MVLPMGRSILYVQPVYLKAERGELPELKRVVLSSGGQVVWGETLQEAVGRLVGGERASSSTEDSPPGADGPRSDGGEVKNVLLRAREALKRSREALKLYDFAAYGRAMRDLEEALEEMSRYLSGGDGP